jgi:hypothetical protein
VEAFGTRFIFLRKTTQQQATGFAELEPSQLEWLREELILQSEAVEKELKKPKQRLTKMKW